jgi:hypothetical protein
MALRDGIIFREARARKHEGLICAEDIADYRGPKPTYNLATLSPDFPRKALARRR